MKNTFTLTLLFVLITLISNAQEQTFTLQGVVQDTKGEAVYPANVSLLNATDSSWLQTASTNEQGEYLMNDVQAGVYIIDARMLGFEPTKTLVTVTANTKGVDVILVSNGTQMDELVITGRKNRIETELGKTIVNISNEMKLGKNLYDLLQDVPGVIVSPTGEISIQGKDGITLIIDDKPVHFTGKSLMEYLKSLDAVNIEKIELMTNPSAKYDAAGNAGVILVKSSKQKKDGFYGNASGSYIQGMYPFFTGNSTVNYQKAKLGVNLTPSIFDGQSFFIADRITTARDPLSGSTTSIVKEDGFMLEEFSDYSLNVGVDYDFTKRTKASASVKGVYHPNEEEDNFQSVINNYITAIELTNLTKNERGLLRKNIQANIFVKHELDSNKKLVFNGDYFTEDRTNYQRLNSTNYGSDGVAMADSLLLNNITPVASSIYSFKADYEQDLTNGKLEAGVKTSYVTIDEKNQFDILRDDQWINDTARTNHFLYDENISAAYVNASTKKGKWQAQTGIRAEHTYAKGKELVKGDEFERNYTKVFPTAYVTYKANDKHTIEANYGKRIQRPYYRELNPFTMVVSQYHFSKGNPYLAPMFTNNIELKHNYRSMFITTVSYSLVNGVFTKDLRFDNATNVSNYSTTNNGSKRSTAISAFFNKQINDWWGVSANANAWYTEFEGRFEDRDVYASTNGLFMKIDTQLTLKDGWYVKLAGSYLSPFRTSALTTLGGWVSTDFEVSKSVLNDTGNIRLSTRDPFGIYRNVEGIELPNVTTVSDPTINVRNITLSFNYNFGDKKNNNKRNSRLEEADRI